jgi:hypothetical protein
MAPRLVVDDRFIIISGRLVTRFFPRRLIAVITSP